MFPVSSPRFFLQVWLTHRFNLQLYNTEKIRQPSYVVVGTIEYSSFLLDKWFSLFSKVAGDNFSVDKAIDFSNIVYKNALLYAVLQIKRADWSNFLSRLVGLKRAWNGTMEMKWIYYCYTKRIKENNHVKVCWVTPVGVCANGEACSWLHSVYWLNLWLIQQWSSKKPVLI